MFDTLTNEYVLGQSNKMHHRSFDSEVDKYDAANDIIPPYIPQKTVQRPPSQEQQQFYSKEDDLDEYAPSLEGMYPGDFVEIRR